jgi:hypothetical protein
MAEEKEFVFEDWLVEGVKGLSSYRKGRKVLPTEFAEHMQASHREMLLAIRSLVEAAIQRTEEKPKKRATKIKVEQGSSPATGTKL